MNNLPVLAGLAAVAIFGGAILAFVLSDSDDGDEEGEQTGDVAGEATSEGTETAVAEETVEDQAGVPPPEVSGTQEIGGDLLEVVRGVVEGYSGPAGDRYTLLNAAATEDSEGRLLIAAVGVDTGSTNGAGQRIFYFLGDDYQGTDWVDPVISIERVTALDDGYVEVVYRVFEGGEANGSFTWYAYFDDAGPENPEQPPQGVFVGF